MKHWFEGWYFKHQSEQGAVAFIPARHIDEKGVRSASLQIVTESGARTISYPYDALWADRKNVCIVLGGSAFSPRGIHLSVEAEGVSAYGDIHYGKITPLRYDIMGPFRCVPGMECRHKVFSMTHSVWGDVALNGKKLNLTGGVGYMEGDIGRSFPRKYLWTQCGFRDESPCSLMLSVAQIPFCGRTFTGVIAIVYWRGKEYRLATYLGAKVFCVGGRKVIVRQGQWVLMAELLSSKDTELDAPVCGGMTRRIRESLSCHAHYRFCDSERTLFQFTSDRASFEFEYGLD